MRAPRPSVGSLVAAVLLPPLGIYLARGIGPDFWLGAVLTVLGWLPGAIFALAALLNGGVLRQT